MMTSQAGGKLSGTGCAAGVAIPAGAPIRARPGNRLAAGPACPGALPGSHAGTAVLAVITSRPGSTSPAATSHRRAAMVSALPAAVTASPPSASQPARRGGRYQDVPEPAVPVGARVPRASTAPRRAGVGTDTGPGAALYDTGPSAADFATTRIHADPDLADSDVFPRVRADIPETEAKAAAEESGQGTRPAVPWPARRR